MVSLKTKGWLESEIYRQGECNRSLPKRSWYNFQKWSRKYKALQKRKRLLEVFEQSIISPENRPIRNETNNSKRSLEEFFFNFTFQVWRNFLITLSSLDKPTRSYTRNLDLLVYGTGRNTDTRRIEQSLAGYFIGNSICNSLYRFRKLN